MTEVAARPVRHRLGGSTSHEPRPAVRHKSASTRVIDLERDYSALPLAGPPSWESSLVRGLWASDFVAGSLAAAIAALVRFGSSLSPLYWVVSVCFPFLWVGSVALLRAYEPRFLGSGPEEYRRVFDAGVRLLALTAIFSFAGRLDLARMYVLIALPTALTLTLVGRYTGRQILHRGRRRGRWVHRVVVVGRERSCAELIRQLRREPYAGFSVVGACVDRSQDDQVEDVPIVGSSRSILSALRGTGADTVAVGAWSDLSQSDLRSLSWQLEGSGISLVVAPSLTDVAGPRIHIRPISGLPLLHVEEPEFRGSRRVVRGVIDRVMAATALLLVSPLLLAVTVAVRLTSPGPAFFRQTRVGVDGQEFRIFKFRSMFVDAEERLADLREHNEAEGLLFKMRNDPRVTPLGGLLRRYSLDELPQLFNVVRGDMSLVGPRPPLPDEVALYAHDVRRRLLVKPGLTGLWQVSGRSDLTWEESVRLDLHYVENWSLAMDLVILGKTLHAVLAKRGAY